MERKYHDVVIFTHFTPLLSTADFLSPFHLLHIMAINDNNKGLYTPSDVLILMHQLKKIEGSFENIFKKKNKYKLVLEMYNAIPFVLSLSQIWERKLLMYPSDSPDLWLIDTINKQTLKVELTEISSFQILHSDDRYKELVKNIWEKKKHKRYDTSNETHLLITQKKRLS